MGMTESDPISPRRHYPASYVGNLPGTRPTVVPPLGPVRQILASEGGEGVKRDRPGGSEPRGEGGGGPTHIRSEWVQFEPKFPKFHQISVQ